VSVPCRTFLGMEVSAGCAQLLELVRVVDKTMTEFQLDTFYEVSNEKHRFEPVKSGAETLCETFWGWIVCLRESSYAAASHDSLLMLLMKFPLRAAGTSPTTHRFALRELPPRALSSVIVYFILYCYNRLHSYTFLSCSNVKTIWILICFLGSVFPREFGLVCWRPDGEDEGVRSGAAGKRRLYSVSSVQKFYKVSPFFTFCVNVTTQEQSSSKLKKK